MAIKRAGETEAKKTATVKKPRADSTTTEVDPSKQAADQTGATQQVENGPNPGEDAGNNAEQGAAKFNADPSTLPSGRGDISERDVRGPAAQQQTAGGRRAAQRGSDPEKEMQAMKSLQEPVTVTQEANVAALPVGTIFYAAWLHNPDPTSNDGRHVAGIKDALITGRVQRHGLSPQYWASYADQRPPRAERTERGWRVLD